MKGIFSLNTALFTGGAAVLFSGQCWILCEDIRYYDSKADQYINRLITCNYKELTFDNIELMYEGYPIPIDINSENSIQRRTKLLEITDSLARSEAVHMRGTALFARHDLDEMRKKSILLRALWGIYIPDIKKKICRPAKGTETGKIYYSEDTDYPGLAYYLSDASILHIYDKMCEVDYSD